MVRTFAEHLFIVIAISKASFTIPIATEVKPAAQEQHCNAKVKGENTNKLSVTVVKVMLQCSVVAVVCIWS